MNSIDSGTSTAATLSGAGSTVNSDGTTGVATASQGVVTTASSPAMTTLSSNSVSPALQAVKQSVETAPAVTNSERLSIMHKAIDALVGVVNALVSVVNLLVGHLKGNTTTAPGGSSGNSVAPGAGSPSNPTSNPGTPVAAGATPGAPVVRSALDVNSNDAGMITVRTLDGFTVRAEGREEAWSITGPDGRTTRIWGDPHVSESDGDRWDFLNRATFMFGKNKATVEVVPAGNGQTLSARLTIYSDHERVTIDGINNNKPNIIAASSDGLQHDASLADGDIYKRVVTEVGESWVSATTGKSVPVTRTAAK
jgi:hypothetical protein